MGLLDFLFRKNARKDEADAFVALSNRADPRSDAPPAAAPPPPREIPAPLAPEALSHLAAWLAERAERRSTKNPNNAVVFDIFHPEPIDVPEDHAADYFGVPWPAKFGFMPAPGKYISPIPPVSEEYFEFIDVFESALDARDSFTMLEWGAGFGRWTGLAVGAAKRRGISKISLSLVEAEPIHAGWIVEYMEALGLSTAEYKIEKVALSNRKGHTVFVTGMPTGNDDPSQWYGQAIANLSGFKPNGKDYYGQPEYESPDGWRGIQVPLCPASKLVEDFDFIDLIDMDLQGAEADAVEECIDLLDAKVRRLHIGTHAHDIEDRLRATLGRHHWILLRDLPCLGPVETSFGKVECVDGVQSWFNPRFPPPDWHAPAQDADAPEADAPDADAPVENV